MARFFSFRNINLLLLLPLLAGCNPIYVLQGAYQQGMILARREPIQRILKEESHTPEEREKLRLVLEAREFSKTIGLTPSKSFTSFSRVDTDVLSWIVSASRKDSFTFKLWWFPIVGEVPYKGFFNKEDAVSQARALEDDGYETWVRGTDAFSTLGWFNDPILSTTLKRSIMQIANTVIHETLHATVWIPNHVDFNESLANFVGTEGAVQFLEQRASRCTEATGCTPGTAAEHFTEAKRERDAEYEISEVVATLYEGLGKIYSSHAPLDIKMKLREDFFDRTTAPLRARYPNLRVLKKINNGEIAQFYLYTRGLKDFNALFTQSRTNWQIFLEEIKAIRDKSKKDGVSPFELLRTKLT